MPTDTTPTGARRPSQGNLFQSDAAPPMVPVVTTRLVCEQEAPWPRTQVSSPDAVVAFFREYFSDRLTEEFWIVLLNTANVVVSLSQVSTGGLAASIVEPRAVFRTAILANAAAIICLHNHPSGAPRGAYVEC